MNNKLLLTKIVLTLILAFGLQYAGIYLYSLAGLGGCLATPLWMFSYGYSISIFLFWYLPIMVYRDMSFRSTSLLFILNIVTFLGIFYGVAFLFPDLIS